MANEYNPGDLVSTPSGSAIFVLAGNDGKVVTTVWGIDERGRRASAEADDVSLIRRGSPRMKGIASEFNTAAGLGNDSRGSNASDRRAATRLAAQYAATAAVTINRQSRRAGSQGASSTGAS